MSIGRTKEEQQLTAMLAQTLVRKEVMEPMEKIGWGHGTPPAPDYTGQPGPAEGAPGQPAPVPAAPASGPPAPAPTRPTAAPTKTDTPQNVDLVALFESLRDPDTGLIGKKYKTVEEAIKGNVHLVHMAKDSYKRAEEATRQLLELQNLRQTPAPAYQAAAPQPSPDRVASRATLDQAQANLDAVLSQITENGGVLDGETMKTLSKAQRELAEAAAENRVLETRNLTQEKETADRTEWGQVDKFMTEKYPASARFSEEVALHVESDPLLGDAIRALLREGNFDGKRKATELAWTSFERAHGSQVAAEAQQTNESREAELAAREQVRQEQVARARKDAGVVTGSAGGAGAHENPNAGGASREEIEMLRDAMRREGDAPGSPAAMRFRRAIIPLDPAIFGPQ